MRTFVRTSASPHGSHVALGFALLLLLLAPFGTPPGPPAAALSEGAALLSFDPPRGTGVGSAGLRGGFRLLSGRQLLAQEVGSTARPGVEADTFQDGRTGYFFEINPAGLMGDGLIDGGGGGLNKRWDGIWEVRTQILPDGWSAEIRIPFSTLNFDPGRDTWGINFQRTIRRRSGEILWSGWGRNESLFR